MTESATVAFARRDLGTLVVTGKDRATWLNGLVTNEVGKAKPGDGVLGLAVGKTGKILAELWILVAEDRLLIGLARDKTAALLEHFNRHLIMEDAELEDASKTFRWLSVVGAKSVDAIAIAKARGDVAAALDWTGNADAVVIATSSPAGDLERDLAQAGAPLIDELAYETLRVGWGVPAFGVDFSEENVPHEASLDKLAVSFTKGCYLGQEAVFMLEARGHAKKHLARIQVTGDEVLPRGAPITLPDGADLGQVTSAVRTPGGVVALGFVKHKHAVAGAELLVGGRPAKLVDLAGRPSPR